MEYSPMLLGVLSFPSEGSFAPFQTFDRERFGCIFNFLGGVVPFPRVVRSQNISALNEFCLGIVKPEVIIGVPLPGMDRGY